MRKALTLGAAFAVIALAPLSGAAQMKQIDFSNKPELLKTNFQHYGEDPKAKTIYFEPSLRFWLEPTTKDAKQSGLYSYFALTGDFEVTVTYEWRTVPEPKEGYGISCGIAVDCEGKTVAIARGFQIGKGDGNVVTKKVSGKNYETKIYATTASKGRLVLRRTKDKVICLAADGDDTLEELDKIPFTAASVRKLRIFADPGDKPNALDCVLTSIQVRAQEIAGDIPEAERGSNLWWWLTGGFLIAGTVAGYLGYRRWQDDKWLWARAKAPRTK